MNKQTSNKIDLAVGVCIIFEGKVLLMHHAKLDKWLFPGGHIDPNETPDDAAKREVKEETGLDIKLLNFSSILKSDGEIKKLALPFHANLHNVGDHDHYCLYYLASVKNPEFVKNEESKDLQWFTIEDLDKIDNLLPIIKNLAVHALKIFYSLNGNKK